jgi:hypothetical protein
MRDAVGDMNGDTTEVVAAYFHLAGMTAYAQVETKRLDASP